MNKEIKKKWVEALRSGKYKQGTGALHQGKRFCCLGVLCDIKKKELKLRWKKYDDTKELEFDGENEYLPISVMKWSGLKGNHGDKVSIEDSPEWSLTTHNDNGMNFKQIAQAIEDQL